jgi:methylenetetrahydrofolate dehydrogenase (NAD+)
MLVWQMLTNKCQVVSPVKDVEGLNVKFHYNLYHKSVKLHSELPSDSNAKFQFSIRYIKPQSLLNALPQQSADVPPAVKDNPPPGTVKSIIPCTPLAIVKCLEYVGVYNKILQYGDRLYGKTVTIVNRYVRVARQLLPSRADGIFSSEVVGRPLAALLSNDGARVFSVDIDSIQVILRLLRSSFAPSLSIISQQTSSYVTLLSPIRNTPSDHNRQKRRRLRGDTTLGTSYTHALRACRSALRCRTS